jgi:hypothetical protein
MYRYAYEFDKRGRRAMVGLSLDETEEFEQLEARLPLVAAELRWLELFNKHDHARTKLARQKQLELL